MILPEKMCNVILLKIKPVCIWKQSIKQKGMLKKEYISSDLSADQITLNNREIVLWNSFFRQTITLYKYIQTTLFIHWCRFMFCVYFVGVRIYIGNLFRLKLPNNNFSLDGNNIRILFFLSNAFGHI